MVIWSLPAKQDLRHIYDYISNDSKYFARKAVNTFIEKTEQLDDFPRMGRIIPEIESENVRELIIYSYRLIYQVSEVGIEVLAIIHGKQSFPYSKFADK